MAIVRFSLARYATASLALVFAASAAIAAPPPDQACRSAKLKGAGKYAAGVLGCEAKAAKDGRAEPKQAGFAAKPRTPGVIHLKRIATTEEN